MLEIEKSKKFNTLIPEILDQSKRYLKKFRNNVKITNMLTEFEIRSSNKFDNYVRQSIDRYKSLKVGKDLNFVLNNTKKLRIKEANEILTNKFYSDGNLRDIRNFKTSQKSYKNLRKSFDKIRQENPKNNGIRSTLYFSHKREKTDNIKISKDEKLDQNKKIINNILENDQNKISLMLNEYEEKLKKLDSFKDKDMDQYFASRKKLSIVLPNINLLNYVPYPNIKIKEPDEEEIQKSILKTIIPYCKSNYFENKDKIVKKSKSTLNRFNRLTGNSSTNEALITTAYKQFNDYDIFNRKSEKIENILGVDSIPDYPVYESIIKSKFKEVKANRYKLNNDNNSNIRMTSSPNYFENANNKIDESICFLTNVESSIFNINNKVPSSKEIKVV